MSTEQFLNRNARLQLQYFMERRKLMSNVTKSRLESTGSQIFPKTLNHRSLLEGGTKKLVDESNVLRQGITNISRNVLAAGDDQVVTHIRLSLAQHIPAGPSGAGTIEERDPANYQYKSVMPDGGFPITAPFLPGCQFNIKQKGQEVYSATVQDHFHEEIKANDTGYVELDYPVLLIAEQPFYVELEMPDSKSVAAADAAATPKKPIVFFQFQLKGAIIRPYSNA